MVLEDKEPTAEELRAYEGCADSDRSTAEARFGSGLPNGHSLSGNGFLLTGDVIWEVPGEDIAKAGFIGNLGDNLDRQFSAAAQGKGSERASSKVLVPVAASILDEEQLAVTPAVTWDLKTGRVKSESSTFSTCPWCGSAISADGRRVLTGFTDWSHYRRDTDEYRAQHGHRIRYERQAGAAALQREPGRGVPGSLGDATEERLGRHREADR